MAGKHKHRVSQALLAALCLAGCATQLADGSNTPRAGSILRGGGLRPATGPRLTPEGGSNWPWSGSASTPAGGPKSDQEVGQAPQGDGLGGDGQGSSPVGDFVQPGSNPANPTPATATVAPGSTPAPAGATPTPAAATPTPAGATPTPAAATPTPAAATPTPAAATPTPTPAPAPALAPGVALALTSKLELISRLGFLQGNAGLIGNNGGTLLSNNGAGLLSNNGGSYRLAQAGGYRLAQAVTPEVALDLVPRTAVPLPETLQVRRAWAAGGGKLRFRPPADTTGDNFRDVDLHPNGNFAWREAEEEVTERHPNGSIKLLKVVKTTMGDDGALRLYRKDVQEKASGTKQALRYRLTDPPLKVRVPETGVAQDIEAYELDVPAGTGLFRYRFLGTNHTEEGTLSQVVNGPDGQSLTISTGDPLGVYAGQASVRDAGGALLYTKQRRLEGGKVFRRYDLGDGLVLDLERGAGNLFSGPVTLNGANVGSATLGIFADGTHRFNLSLTGMPSQVIGYGYSSPDLPAQPRPRAAWVSTTVAGGAKGDVQGVGLAARFQELRCLVASPSVANRWFAADLGAHRIVQVDLGATITVSPFAGTGVAGDANGPAASASFRGPWGLAFGADQSLYVSEALGQRIRRIRPDGVVETVAGDASATGTANGTGAEARFNQPTGLAVIGDRLFVADTQNHRIRAIQLDDPNRTVSNLAGSGIGLNDPPDGALLAASIPLPIGLVADGPNLVVSANRLLRRVDLGSGQVSTVAGYRTQPSPSVANFFDGPFGESGMFPSTALWANPQGGWVVGAMDLRAVGTDGALRTLSGQSFFGNKDGEHDESSFNRIYGIARVGNDAFLVAEAKDPAQGSSPATSQLRLLRFRPAP